MNRKPIRKTTWIIGPILVLSLLAGCGGQAASTPAATSAASTNVAAATTAGSATTTNVAATSSVTKVTATTAAAVAAPTAVAEHVVDLSGATEIVLSGSSITVAGTGADGVSVDGSKVTITRAGAYSLSGTLADGQVVVDTKDEAEVLLVLNGVDISSSTSAPIYIADAEDAVIILANGAKNTVSDGNAYVLEADSDEPNAAIFSKADLTIEGKGALTVEASYNDGIASKDSLTITGGVLTVDAVDDGIRGKDYLFVTGGDFTVQAGGDGLKSDIEDDPALGYVTIEAGVLNVTAGGDAISGQTDVAVAGGELTLTSGGGRQNSIDETASAKGIKGLVRVDITGGIFIIDSADDAIHSNGAIAIQGGAFDIATGDDAVHADASIEINGGDFRITECYEGIESATIAINAGNIHLVSSDDGLNVAGGQDASGMMPGPGRGGRPGRGGATGQDVFATSSSQYLHINGGTIWVDAGGDGIDINGSVEMTDGVLIVNGPTANMNGPLDYDAGFKMTGGYLLAVGSAGMAMAPDASSTQYAVLLNLSSAVRAGSLLHIQSSSGEEIVTFAPTKQVQSIAFSSPSLAKGESYELYVGGSSTGTAMDGLYQGGAYSGGSQAGSFTISSIVTQVGGRMR